jgi:N-glycosidase YbiA
MKAKNKNSITSFIGDNKFLSNFYTCKVVLDDIEYSSVEHAYQAAKTLNTKERKPFHKHPLPTAAESKKMGRKLTIRSDWESVKLKVMEDLLVQKFAIPELKEMLTETKGKTLVEGNYWGDDFWGVDNRKGGQNHLGKLLMAIRDKSNDDH